MSDATEEPDFLYVHCTHCNAGLRIRSRLAGHHGRCPQCGQEFLIPVRPDILPDLDMILSEDEWAAPTGLKLAESIDFEGDDHPEPLPDSIRAPAPVSTEEVPQSSIRHQPDEPIPRILFVSGVFTFPWYPEVWPKWTYLVMGGIAISAIPILALQLLGSAAGYAGVVLVFFAMPQIWLSLWSGSYAAACGMQVFHETAAGCDHVTGWPEPNWREWMWPLMLIVYVSLMVLALGYGLCLALNLQAEGRTTTLIVSQFFLLPICLLSVLETNNLALLLSPTIASTIWRRPLAWIGFYLVTALLLGAWAGTVSLAWKLSAYLAAPINGLFYATAVLIWFRLLGRLGWAISRQSRKRKRRKQPHSES